MGRQESPQLIERKTQVDTDAQETSRAFKYLTLPKSTVHNLRPHAAFDNGISGRPHVILNIRFGGRAGVY